MPGGWPGSAVVTWPLNPLTLLAIHADVVRISCACAVCSVSDAADTWLVGMGCCGRGCKHRGMPALLFRVTCPSVLVGVHCSERSEPSLLRSGI